MCTERNYLWALAQFNKAAMKYCKLTLNPLRHIWVAWSRKVSAQVAHQAVGSDKVRRVMTAAALMSNHSLEGEEDKYAGEANVGGVEGIKRIDFKILSQAFNGRVYVDEVKGRCSLHLTAQTSQPPPHQWSNTQLQTATQRATWWSGLKAKVCASYTSQLTPHNSQHPPSPSS